MNTMIRCARWFLLVGVLAPGFLAAQVTPSPAWWTTPVSIFNGQAQDNWTIANVGQLKHVATRAKQHLEATLNVTPAEWDAAYAPYPNPLSTFQPGANLLNYAPLNIGQLKFVASGFYKIINRKAPGYDVRGGLLSLGVMNEMISGAGPFFPWIAPWFSVENYSPVAVGQLKLVFSFDVTGHSFGPSNDTDADGMPDQWEISIFGSTIQSAATDFDRDGLKDIQECYLGTDPKKIDTDSDGISDLQDKWPLFVSRLEGQTVIDHVADYVDSRLAGRTVEELASTQPAFTIRNQYTGEFQRNTNLWCADIVQQLTCVSPESKAGTLISPRHVVFATHHRRGVGETIRFIGVDSSIVSRVIIAERVLHRNNMDGLYPDITIGVLDSDVPASISHAAVLPKELWRFYINQPSLQGATSRKLPVMQLDQGMRVTVADAYVLEGVGLHTAGFIMPDNFQRRLFYKLKVSGDSGHPSFLAIDGRLALVSVFTTSGTGTFLSSTDIYDEINAMMRQLGGGSSSGGVYQLTPVDLSNFVWQDL